MIKEKLYDTSNFDAKAFQSVDVHRKPSPTRWL